VTIILSKIYHVTKKSWGVVTTHRRGFQRFISIRSNILTDVKMITDTLSQFSIFYSTPSVSKKMSYDTKRRSHDLLTGPKGFSRRFLPVLLLSGRGVNLSRWWFDDMMFAF
jgi:hypothetical protein